jgi:hypothetical protein
MWQEKNTVVIRSFLFILALTAFPGAVAWAAPVARVGFAIGKVIAIDAAGVTRPLSKDSELNQGDTVNTDGGRAQVRFIDGAYVSLQPNTQFKIDEYKYDGKTDGTEKGSLSLLKGALRTITGAIGHVNKDTYRLHTEAATIGIRGTEYLASVENSLSVSVGDGAISLTNKAGELVVASGQSAYVANASSMPVMTFQKPTLPPEAAPQRKASETEAAASTTVPYVAGDQVGDRSPITSTVPPPTNGKPSVASSIDGNTTYSVYSDNSSVQHTAVTVGFNSSGVATQLYDKSLNVWTDAGTAQVSGGTSGAIGWTRWVDGTLNDTGSTVPFPGAYQGAHHVFGVPTPASDLAALGAANVTATYTVVGYTIPTFTDGIGAGLGNGVVTGSITPHFGTGTVDIATLLSFQGGANQYHNDVTGMSMPNTLSSGVFSGTASATHTGTLTDCASGCQVNWAGFFAGANASNAGVTYRLVSDRGFQIQGVVAYGK